MAKKRERKKYKEQHNGEQAALSVCRIGETMGGQMWLHKTFFIFYFSARSQKPLSPPEVVKLSLQCRVRFEHGPSVSLCHFSFFTVIFHLFWYVSRSIIVFVS